MDQDEGQDSRPMSMWRDVREFRRTDPANGDLTAAMYLVGVRVVAVTDGEAETYDYRGYSMEYDRKSDEDEGVAQAFVDSVWGPTRTPVYGRENAIAWAFKRFSRLPAHMKMLYLSGHMRRRERRG